MGNKQSDELNKRVDELVKDKQELEFLIECAQEGSSRSIVSGYLKGFSHTEERGLYEIIIIRKCNNNGHARSYVLDSSELNLSVQEVGEMFRNYVIGVYEVGNKNLDGELVYLRFDGKVFQSSSNE
tara:strand:+ start:7632 stop:8009 length:378 start_codon:yes stop_codon:yes gene_type:complete